MKQLLCALLLLCSGTAFAQQVTCFQYGSLLSCSSPTGITTVTPLSPTSGVVYQRTEQGSSLSPYTVIPAPPAVAAPANTLTLIAPLLPFSGDGGATLGLIAP
jgi:hypothetical protein